MISAQAGEIFYLGTFTKPGKSQGIYRYELDPTSGAVKELGLAVETQNPAFLTIHPNGKYLYSVNEVNPGIATAFAIQPDGKLKELNHQSTRGSGPTHLSIDHAGKHIVVANYNSGSVAALPVKEDGSLGEATGFAQATGTGPNAGRQKGPHAHSVYVAEGDQQVYSCDLGVDKVFIYQLDPATGVLKPDEPPFQAMTPGSGPRHLAFGKGSNFIYVVGEMSNTVTVLSVNVETGALKEIQQVSTLPEGFTTPNTSAEIMVHPSGSFLYTSNRGSDTIAAFAIDPQEGTLKPIGHTPTQGKGPRFFGLDPSGKFLLAANQATNNVVIFRIDEKTGQLTPTGKSFEQSEPVCTVFVK